MLRRFKPHPTINQRELDLCLVTLDSLLAPLVLTQQQQLSLQRRCLHLLLLLLLLMLLMQKMLIFREL